MIPHSQKESHRTDRIGWLRAAVLGANDGIISTASLMPGVAAASSSPRDMARTLTERGAAARQQLHHFRHAFIDLLLEPVLIVDNTGHGVLRPAAPDDLLCRAEGRLRCGQWPLCVRA